MCMLYCWASFFVVECHLHACCVCKSEPPVTCSAWRSQSCTFLLTRLVLYSFFDIDKTVASELQRVFGKANHRCAGAWW